LCGVLTGANCEVNLDDCQSNPCDYGRCIDKINGYECACEPGYTGKWSQIMCLIHQLTATVLKYKNIKNM